MTFNITVLISGNGTNLQEIIDRTNAGILGQNVRICHVISNKKDAYGITRAQNANIPVTYLPYLKKEESREYYDQRLVSVVLEHQPALIVLAGWMHVLSATFLNQIQIPIINLHPALPGRFPGVSVIEQAFNTYQEHIKSGSPVLPDNLKTTNQSEYAGSPVTGCMVHLVVPEIDAGEVIMTGTVPIKSDDTLETLTQRVQWIEKPTLIQGILKMIDRISKSNNKDAPHINNTPHINYTPFSCDVKLVSKGKVRDIWQLGNNLLAMISTDRCSSFDRHICNIPLKGFYLNHISKWWFNNTKHIIPNHLLCAYNNISVVKRCQVIPIEVVVRGYMARSKTSTSLWTNYNKCPPGRKVYCGITFPDDLEPNCILPNPVVTPTTKSTDHDLPISGDEVVQGDYGVLQKEWNYISQKAIELYIFGSMIADKIGLILVDTKFEFGRDQDGIITLIDEILTPDSSRYWVKKTYQERIAAGLDPESLDKDLIRQYVAERCNPYDPGSTIPSIPKQLIENVQLKYETIYHYLTQMSQNSSTFN
jgi:phosphoribosylaminoimidazole-succinocarboxamide synthase